MEVNQNRQLRRRRGSDNNDVRNTRRRTRRRTFYKKIKTRMGIPKTFLEIGAVFEKVKGIKHFYFGRTFGSDGSIADIFTTRSLLHRMENASELFIESTVQGVIKRPKASHVIKFLLRHGKQGVLACIALCSSNSEESFKNILNFLINNAPGIKNRLQTVFADVSDVTISAINEVIPWVSQKISWFNFTRTITQKWESLQLPKRNDELYILLRLVWTLPTVSVDSYDAAVLHVTNEFKKNELSNSNLKIFLSYLLNVWFPYPEKVLTWDILWDQQWITELFNQNLSRVLNFSQNQTLKQFIVNVPVMLKETMKTLSQPESNGNKSQITTDEIPKKILQFIHKLHQTISEEKLSIKFFFDGMIKNVVIQDTIEIARSRRPIVLVQSDNVNEWTQMSDNIRNNVVAVETVISSQLRSESTTSLENGLTDDNSMNEGSSIVIHDDGSEMEEPRSSINAPIDDQIIVISDDETPENNSTEQVNSDVEVPNLDTVIVMDEFPTLIREQLQSMVFDDLKATTTSKICSSCLCYQPRASFRPCGHRSLCLRCKKGFELLSEGENFTLKCIVCNSPSLSIMALY